MTKKRQTRSNNEITLDLRELLDSAIQAIGSVKCQESKMKGVDIVKEIVFNQPEELRNSNPNPSEHLKPLYANPASYFDVWIHVFYDVLIYDKMYTMN